MNKMMFRGALYGYDEGEAMKIRVDTIKDIVDAYNSHSSIIQNKVSLSRVIHVKEIQKRLCDAIQEDNLKNFHMKILKLIDELS